MVKTSTSVARLRVALGFRGADGKGLRLGVWLSVLGVTGLIALLYAPLEPAVVLVPPMLALAVLGPVVQALGARDGLLRRFTSKLARFEISLMALSYAAVGVGVFGAMWRRGMLIDTGDNQYMMARAQLFYEGLRHGQVQHWTHLWQAGDTLIDLYPMEANLLTIAVHLLSPRGTTFATSYTEFVLLSWWLRGVGAYYVARRFSSPSIAWVLGWALLFDVGADVWNGTWFAAIYFGMVHNTLAMTFGLFAVALQIDLTRRVTGARFVAAALLVALTTCGHPLGMLAMVIATFALAVAAWLAPTGRREASWALAASVLGLALSAIWVLPYTRALDAGNFSVATPGTTFSELGKGLLGGLLPTSSFAGFTGLAVLAAATASVSAEVGLAASGIASLVLLGLAVTPFLVGARVLHYFPAFLEAQPLRMLTALKTVVVPCVAWALTSVVKRVPRSTGSLGVSRVLARTVLLGIAIYGPGRALLSGMDALGSSLREQVPHVGPGAERSHTGPDYRQVFDFIANQRKRDPSPLRWRTAVLWKATFRHATWAEGMNTGVPIVDPNQVPSNFFEIRPREVSSRGFNDWNIRFALTDDPLPPFPEAVERFASGPFHVWEVVPFDARYALAPPGVRVTDVKLEGETIRFHVEGAPPDGADIQLRTAAFVRWRARQGDEWLKVWSRPPRSDAKAHQEQLVVHAGNGDVVMTCDGNMPGYFSGLFVSLAAAVAIGSGASARRRRRVDAICRVVARAAASIHAASREWRGPLKAAAATTLVALLVLGIVMRVRGTGDLHVATLEGVDGLWVEWRKNGRLQKCLPAFWRGQFICGSGEVIVDGWLGTKAPGDDSGEAATLWPGIRVTSKKPSDVVLHFGKVHLDAPDGLWLQNSTWNAHLVQITWGGIVLATSKLSGEEMHQFPLPAGKGGGRPLTIELLAPAEASYCVIRCGAGEAPPFR